MSFTKHFTYHNPTNKNDKTNQISKCFLSAMDVSPTYHLLTFIQITYNTFHNHKRIKIVKNINNKESVSLTNTHTHTCVCVCIYIYISLSFLKAHNSCRTSLLVYCQRHIMSSLANLTTEADNHVPQFMFQDLYCSAYSEADINHSTCNSVSKNTLYFSCIMCNFFTPQTDNFQLKSAYMKSPGTPIDSTDIQRCCR
jgi:hypothetical protein